MKALKALRIGAIGECKETIEGDAIEECGVLGAENEPSVILMHKFGVIIIAAAKEDRAVLY